MNSPITLSLEHPEDKSSAHECCQKIDRQWLVAQGPSRPLCKVLCSLLALASTDDYFLLSLLLEQESEENTPRARKPDSDFYGKTKPERRRFQNNVIQSLRSQVCFTESGCKQQKPLKLKLIHLIYTALWCFLFVELLGVSISLNHEKRFSTVTS